MENFKPLLFRKIRKKNNNSILIENNGIVSDDKETTEIFRNNFSNMTNFIDISEYQPPEDTYLSLRGPVLRAIKKYKHHPIILTIKNLIFSKDIGFEFKPF